jgi:hypothetical protein
MTGTEDHYIRNRVDDQIAYFDRRAVQQKRLYRAVKATAVVSSVLTTLAIALAFAFPGLYQPMGIVALALSTITLGTYQWEEFQGHGPKWEKYRIVTERLRCEKQLYLQRAGRYRNYADEESRRAAFVSAVEGTIGATEATLFSMLLEAEKQGGLGPTGASPQGRGVDDRGGTR